MYTFFFSSYHSGDVTADIIRAMQEDERRKFEFIVKISLSIL